MTYVSEGFQLRDEAHGGANAQPDVLRYWPRHNGKLIAAAAIQGGGATFKVYGPAGALKDDQSAVPTALAADGSFQYKRTFDEPTFPVWEDYFIDWTFSFTDDAGQVVNRVDRQFFDVVRTKLFCSVDDNSLQNLYPDLPKSLLAIGITDGSRFIQQAWITVMNRIRAGGHRPSLILDGSRLADPTLHLALHFACDALSRSTDDIWDKRADKQRKWYEETWTALGQLKYDFRQLGLASPQETSRVGRKRFSV